MGGKKAALLLVGIILLAALAVTIAMQIFFATYEPPKDRVDIKNESSLLSPTAEQSVILVNL